MLPTEKSDFYSNCLRLSKNDKDIRIQLTYNLSIKFQKRLFSAKIAIFSANDASDLIPCEYATNEELKKKAFTVKRQYETSN